LRYKTFQIQENLQIFKGNHTITAGFSYENYQSENVFFPGSQSVYVYNSLADFYKDGDNFLANGNAVASGVNLRRFQVRWNNIPGSEKPVQPLEVNYGGVFIQDEWQARKNLKLTAGLRVDVPFFEQTALRNTEMESFYFRNPAGAYVNFRTDALPEANLLWSPRVGFNWDVFNNQKTQIRGGSGIFTGRPAYVWISNQVGNNGILTGFAQLDNTTTRPFNPDPNKYKPTTVTGAPASSYELALTETNFKFPQVWRTNIAVDQQLPAGIIATGEFIYNQDVNGVAYYNGNLPVASSQFAGNDTRPRWNVGTTPNRINAKIPNAVTLSNQAVGYSWVASFSLERPFANGLFLKAAYSYGESKNTVDAGSIASGSWFNNPITSDPNNPAVGYSSNFMGHRAFATASYSKDFFKFGNTSFSIFWEGRTIGNASYVVGGDLNNDGGTSNDLIYIPATKAEMNFQAFTASGVTFTAAQQADAWEAYILQDKYLSANRGGYAQRGAVIMPMIYRADLSFAQQLFTNIGGKRNTLEFRMDILNVGNLLDSDYGVGKTFNSTQPIVVPSATQGGVASADGRPQYRMRNFGTSLVSETYRATAGVADVWRMQFGLRYIFN